MKSIEKISLLQIISEIFFILLPLIVIFLLLLIDNRQTELFRNTELSFAAIIMFGQTIVKFNSGTSKNNNRKKWQMISAVTSAILVFGIIPTTTLLIKIFEDNNLPIWVYVLQVIIFIVSIITYILLGTVGQIYLDEKEPQ